MKDDYCLVGTERVKQMQLERQLCLQVQNLATFCLHFDKDKLLATSHFYVETQLYIST